MNTCDTQGAVLFADICGSVDIYEKHGNARGLEIAGESMERMTQITEWGGGRVIRTQGDGVKSFFSTVDGAYDAALKMQSSHREFTCDIKVAFSYGPLLMAQDDAFGDTVHLAARLLGLARPGEILLPGDTAKQLSANRRACTSLLDTTRVKGISDPVDVYTVNQREDDTRTKVAVVQTIDQSIPGSRLVLSHRDGEYCYEAGSRAMTIGRAESCDVVVNSSYASRQHARIELKRNYFLLTDQSTNGTYVTNRDNEPVFLKRDAVQLVGCGVISLGRPPFQTADGDIRFFSS
jgi:class 3 adenylate cyclase